MSFSDTYGTEIKVGDLIFDEVAESTCVAVIKDGEWYGAHFPDTPDDWDGYPYVLTGPMEGIVMHRVRVVGNVEVVPLYRESVMEIQVRYNYFGKDSLEATIPFRDADGHYCDDVRVEKIKNKIRVFWGLPGNKNLENAGLHSEAIVLAVQVAEALTENKLLEDAFENVVRVD